MTHNTTTIINTFFAPSYANTTCPATTTVIMPVPASSGNSSSGYRHFEKKVPHKLPVTEKMKIINQLHTPLDKVQRATLLVLADNTAEVRCFFDTILNKNLRLLNEQEFPTALENISSALNQAQIPDSEKLEIAAIIEYYLSYEIRLRRTLLNPTKRRYVTNGVVKDITVYIQLEDMYASRMHEFADLEAVFKDAAKEAAKIVYSIARELELESPETMARMRHVFHEKDGFIFSLSLGGDASFNPETQTVNFPLLGVLTKNRESLKYTFRQEILVHAFEFFLLHDPNKNNKVVTHLDTGEEMSVAAYNKLSISYAKKVNNYALPVAPYYPRTRDTQRTFSKMLIDDFSNLEALCALSEKSSENLTAEEAEKLKLFIAELRAYYQPREYIFKGVFSDLKDFFVPGFSLKSIDGAEMHFKSTVNPAIFPVTRGWATKLEALKQGGKTYYIIRYTAVKDNDLPRLQTDDVFLCEAFLNEQRFTLHYLRENYRDTVRPGLLQSTTREPAITVTEQVKALTSHGILELHSSLASKHPKLVKAAYPQLHAAELKKLENSVNPYVQKPSLELAECDKKFSPFGGCGIL
jgi:hypothetical protein